METTSNIGHKLEITENNHKWGGGGVGVTSVI
jgi:hypothetical protein